MIELKFERGGEFDSARGVHECSGGERAYLSRVLHVLALLGHTVEV